MKKVVLALIIGISVFLAVVYKCFHSVKPRLPIASVKELKQANSLISNLTAIGTSGAFVLVKNDKVIDERYWGYSNYEHKFPVDQKTLFQLGSISKQFTGFVLLQLELEGKLDPEKTVGEYFDGLNDSAIGALQIHQLIHMSGGLPYMAPWSTRILSQIFSYHWESDQIIEEISNYGLLAEKIDNFHYSNISYSLLGAIISKIEGKAFSEVLNDRIFKPFNMYNTFLNTPQWDRVHATIGYYVVGRNLVRVPDWNYSFDIGSSGVMSNIHDLIIWHKALRKFFKRFPQKTADVFFGKSQHLYGYGWAFTKPDLAFHLGESLGFCAYIVIDNEDGMAALTLNTDICLQPVMSEIEKEIDKLLL